MSSFLWRCGSWFGPWAYDMSSILSETFQLLHSEALGYILDYGFLNDSLSGASACPILYICQNQNAYPSGSKATEFETKNVFRPFNSFLKY